MDSAAWREAGLYDPGASDAEGRLALLEYLSERGATLEQMQAANAQHALPALAGDLARTAPAEMVSIEELAARCGAAVEMVERVLLAAGLPIGADSQVPAYLEALIAAFVQGVAVMGERPILAFTRVVGAAAATIAEAAVALFYAELGPGPEVEAGELSRARMAERANIAFTAVPEAFTRILLAHFDRATRRAVMARAQYAPDGADDDPDLQAAEVVPLGFVDLVGSTAWADGLSLREQSMALARFETAAWSSAVLAGGRVVKMIGDAAFFVAPTVEAACSIAWDVCRASAEDPGLPPARAAVGYGPAISREGDYFGPVVNLVSRLAKVGAPNAVVATPEAVAQLRGGRWTTRDMGLRSLRGFDQPVHAFEVAPVGEIRS